LIGKFKEGKLILVRSKKMKKIIGMNAGRRKLLTNGYWLLAIFSSFLFLPISAKAINWETLDYPGAKSTYIQDISDDSIVGYYTDVSNQTHGFFYNGSTWTNFDMQGAQYTHLCAIDGSSYAGMYWDGSKEHGFLYDGTNLVSFETPYYGDRLNIGGLSHGIIAGDYRRYSPGPSEFLYNGSTWTEITVPLGNWSHLNGIDGSNLVGYYSNGNGYHGFLYDGITSYILDMPGMLATYPIDIDGENIVGYYQISSDFKGFLYNGKNWFIIEIPESIQTYVTGIDGNKVVGYYVDSNIQCHGFSYTIPEPITLSLMLFGILTTRKFRG
jgi:hypothetical protein